jgi:hypothetical protein
MTTNKDRDMIISKNIDISVCNLQADIDEATAFVMKWIETDEFQSWYTKLELHVDALWRNYDIGLYRDWDYMHVWFDWNFAYELSLSSWGLKTCISQLFRNWRWVPGIYMQYRWDWSDPLLHWSWLVANYREVEDYLYEDFIDWLRENNKYNQYCKLKKSLQDKKFNDWLFENYYKIVDIFLQLRDINVRKNAD